MIYLLLVLLAALGVGLALRQSQRKDALLKEAEDRGAGRAQELKHALQELKAATDAAVREAYEQERRRQLLSAAEQRLGSADLGWLVVRCRGDAVEIRTEPTMPLDPDVWAYGLIRGGPRPPLDAVALAPVEGLRAALRASQEAVEALSKGAEGAWPTGATVVLSDSEGPDGVSDTAYAFHALQQALGRRLFPGAASIAFRGASPRDRGSLRELVDAVVRILDAAQPGTARGALDARQPLGGNPGAYTSPTLAALARAMENLSEGDLLAMTISVGRPGGAPLDEAWAKWYWFRKAEAEDVHVQRAFQQVLDVLAALYDDDGGAASGVWALYGIDLDEPVGEFNCALAAWFAAGAPRG